MQKVSSDNSLLLLFHSLLSCKGRENYEVLDPDFFPNTLTRNLSRLLNQEIGTKYKERIQPDLL